MKYYDKIGKEIKVGSFVAYAVGGLLDTSICFGVVEEIRDDPEKENGPMIRSYASGNYSGKLMTRPPYGRLMIRPKSGDEVLVLDEFKVQNAEYFI